MERTDSEGFGPSIDWSREILNSAVWLLEAFAVTAACVLLVALIVGRYTEWGRQFRRITAGYFVGRDAVPVWGALAALLFSAVLSVRISALLSFYLNDLFAALQVALEGLGGGNGDVIAAGVQSFWESMLIFAVLATVFVVRSLADLYVMQRFMLRWRAWLTRRVIDDWLGDYAYFRGAFAARPIDNPEQRIQQDVDIVTTMTGEPNYPARGSNDTLLFGAVEAVLTVAVFGVILWDLSGPLTVFDVTLPRALFWIVVVYVLVATALAFWVGRPLIRLSFVNELRNASFRYAMGRLRASASAVGLYRGEDVERRGLHARLDSVVANYRRWLNRMVLFLGFNLTASQAINPLPYLVQAQRLFDRGISLGGVMQSATAFHAIHDALSFFRNAYDAFASYRAALIRLDGLLDANTTAKVMPHVTVRESTDGSLHVEGVDVRTPDGRHLVRALDVRFEPGDAVLVTGPSGSGKTLLLESLAGLWPHCSGTARLPIAQRQMMFVPQLPYLPLGDLRTVTCYPAAADTISSDEVQRALVKVALPHLVIRIGEVKDWAAALSVGEQQRIAFARLLLNRPRVAFLDETTSALDEGLELMLYQLIRQELSETVLISVSHRETVEQHHGRHVQLLGNGAWRLDGAAPDS